MAGDNGKRAGLQVIFGSGPVGVAAARHLLEKGLAVRMVNRSGRRPADLAESPAERLEMRAADALDPRAAIEASAGATHIYNCAHAPYNEFERRLPPLHAGIRAAAREHNAVLAVPQNLYMYARGVPVINETTALEPPSRKGRVILSVHRELVEDGERSGLAWVVVRASDYYGPGSTGQSVFGADRFLDPLYAGKRPALLGDPDLPHTYTYIEDYGAALAVAALTPEAHGRAWIVPNDRTLTSREVAKLFFAAAGRGTDVGRIPRLAVAAAGLFNPVIREVVEMLYQKEEPYVVDGSLFRSRFAFEPTPLEEGIRRTFAWYEARRERLGRPLARSASAAAR